jgi:hypothetical protein
MWGVIGAFAAAPTSSEHVEKSALEGGRVQRKR